MTKQHHTYVGSSEVGVLQFAIDGINSSRVACQVWAPK